MISHLFDTDMLTLFQHGHANIVARCAVAMPGSLAITIISVEEQFLGWYTRARQAKRDDELASAYDRMTEFAGFISQFRSFHLLRRLFRSIANSRPLS
jgi:tRNA(fMet)-specific endonuclease VapC